MEDQIGTVLHWSQKETKQAKSKDEVIRRNLDRIRVSATTSRPSNPSRHNQVSLIKNKQKNYPHVGVTVISIIPQVLNVQFR